MTCVRHACYDRSQGIARSQPVDPGDMADLAHARQRGQVDPHDSSNNSDLLAQAFASLPERWQLVLWSTEVDGRRPAELAKELGLAPGAVASLAYRAREGLTEAFLSAHLQRPSAPACAAIRPRLAAFVRDNVTGREEATIQRHLDECCECQELVGELHELNRPLRGLLVPAVVGVSASAYLAEASVGGAALVPRLVQFLHTRPVFGGAAAASVAVLAGATLTGVMPLKPAEGSPMPWTPPTVVVPNGSGAEQQLAGSTIAGAPATVSAGVPGADVTGAVALVLSGPTGPPAAAGTASAPGVGAAAVASADAGVPAATVTVTAGGASVSLPPVSVPAVSLPTVSLPPVSLPPVSVAPVSLPPVSLPAVSVPPVELPGLPPITVPVVTAPVVTVPVVTVPVVTVPVVTVPPTTVPVITVPPIELPGISTTTLP
jgi:hypothetical protein